MPTLSKKLLQGTVILTMGRVGGYGLSFIRNLILARMLAKADYGLSAIFAMAMMLLEVSGRMSFGIQIIQSKEGDVPDFQSSAHALQFCGGLCSAILLVCLSVPMAHLFGVPHTWWAFAFLAIVPLCQGLSHMDISRFQRELNYGPLILMDVVPQLIVTLAAWPLVIWLGDYRVIVWVIIGKSVLGTAMTFGFAKRPYRWAWNKEYVRSMLNFGWPLLLNGLLMFGSQQLDQMLVGAAFSLQLLANYALAFSLVTIPWFVLGQVMTSLMLPLMARAQDDPTRLRRQYRMCAQIAAIGGVLMLLPLIVAGEQIITLFYGAKYKECGAFMALLGAAAAVRFLRFAPAVAAMAKGDTINQLYSNLWRVGSLPLALVVWNAGGSPVLIAGCALAGEALAIVASIVLLARRQKIPFSESFSAMSYLLVLILAGSAVAFIWGANLSIWIAVAIAIGSFSLALGAAWYLFPDVSDFLIDALKRNSRKTELVASSA